MVVILIDRTKRCLSPKPCLRASLSIMILRVVGSKSASSVVFMGARRLFFIACRGKKGCLSVSPCSHSFVKGLRSRSLFVSPFASFSPRDNIEKVNKDDVNDINDVKEEKDRLKFHEEGVSNMDIKSYLPQFLAKYCNLSFVDSVSGTAGSNVVSNDKTYLLLSVSGGVDSVAMLHLVAEFKNNLSSEHLRQQLVVDVVHFNHRLRKESDEEAEFVRGLARSYAFQFHSHVFQLPQTTIPSSESSGDEKGGKLIVPGVSELARDWRRSVSRQIVDSRVKELGCEHTGFLVTGHHLDDQIETMLLKMLRGVHVSKFYPILPRNGFVIRPMLHFSKAQLVEYMKSHKFTWYEDSSNKERVYKRNSLRLDLIPLLETQAGGVASLRRRLLGMAQQSYELELFLLRQLSSFIDSFVTVAFTNIPKYPFCTSSVGVRSESKLALNLKIVESDIRIALVNERGEIIQVLNPERHADTSANIHSPKDGRKSNSYEHFGEIRFIDMPARDFNLLDPMLRSQLLVRLFKLAFVETIPKDTTEECLSFLRRSEYSNSNNSNKINNNNNNSSSSSTSFSISSSNANISIKSKTLTRDWVLSCFNNGCIRLENIRLRMDLFSNYKLRKSEVLKKIDFKNVSFEIQNGICATFINSNSNGIDKFNCLQNVQSIAAKAMVDPSSGITSGGNFGLNLVKFHVSDSDAAEFVYRIRYILPGDMHSTPHFPSNWKKLVPRHLRGMVVVVERRRIKPAPSRGEILGDSDRQHDRGADGSDPLGDIVAVSSFPNRHPNHINNNTITSDTGANNSDNTSAMASNRGVLVAFLVHAPITLF